MVDIVPAHQEHIASIAADMRQCDRDEVWASSLATPEEALSQSLIASPRCWTALAEGKPIAMFGVAPLSLIGETGVPWFLGANALAQHDREFRRLSLGWVRELQRGFTCLENYVDARNVRSVRWLRWCGFTIHAAAPHGVLSLPFHRFTWRA